MAQLVSKLNPPQIDSSLPAFCAGSVLIVPFNLNRAVGRNQFNQVAIIIRTVQTNVQKYAGVTDSISYDYKTKLWQAHFSFGNEFTPQIGQYYKVQIACVDDVSGTQPVTGYYSTVGVVKCISRPQVYIKDRENTVNNAYEYTGVYSQEDGDFTEKVYSYCFNLYDENNNIIATSGTQLHNSSTDTSIYESTDTWTIRKSLKPNLNYEIGYSITTINNYVSDEVRYIIIDAETVDPNVHAYLSAICEPNDGYIKLFLVGEKKNVFVNGSFILLRASSEDNYDSWNELTRFQLVNWDSNTIKVLCKDYTIQQGCHYKYAIQAYNSAGLYSNKIENIEGPVLCDFEDAFLYDGERQLKIKFNPKVNTFKSTVLETKTDTLGGKYPFIFRNGNVEYKEFQISGLLSILGDENDEFLSGLPLLNNEQRMMTAAGVAPISDMGTWLTADNYRREREFKMTVLSWLTNGKPKLFRSPAEGNFIIRLMNTSLTPNDTLGRMLHTFNSTAYEIATYNYENLQSYGFTVAPYTEARTMKINQIDISDKIRIKIPAAYFASITAEPDIDFSYELSDGMVRKGSTNLTGTFIFPEEVLKSTPLMLVTLESSSWGNPAHITYGYYDTSTDNFSLIKSIDIQDEVNQFLGDGTNPQAIDSTYHNFIGDLVDIRIKIGAFHYLRVMPRLTAKIYSINNNNDGPFYMTGTGQPVTWNPITIYEIVDYTTLEPTERYIDGRYPTKHLSKSNLSYRFVLKDSETNVIIGESDLSGRESLSTKGKFEALTSLSSVGELYLGNALCADAVYQVKTITYSIEEENREILEAKEKWLLAKSKYEELLLNSTDTAQIELMKDKVDRLYNNYINLLEKAIEDLEGENIDYAI